MVDGQLALIAEENPLKFVPVAVAIAALKKAGVAVTTMTIKAATILIAAGKKVTVASVAAVIRAMPVIEGALKVAGKWTGNLLLGKALLDWAEGQCILPHCARPTPDGAGGDVFCRECARKYGQFYGHRL